MSDLIERLERWGRDEGLQNHFIGSRSARKDCAEAATALAEAQATIARQQVMLDRALEASFDDKARADRAEAEIVRLREALEPFAEAAEECDEYGFDDSNQAPVDAGQCREARAALSSPHAAKGEAG